MGEAGGKAAYIKVKLFGDTRLDCEVIRTVRRYCSPEETFLIGDVNCGYRPDARAGVSLEWIARQLDQLRRQGWMLVRTRLFWRSPSGWNCKSGWPHYS